MFKGYLYINPAIFRIKGADAERYLNARLTNDIRSITNNASAYAACCNAKGRVEGLFLVYKERENSYILFADKADNSLISALMRYKVADDVHCLDISSNYKAVFFNEFLYNQIKDGVDLLIPIENFFQKRFYLGLLSRDNHKIQLNDIKLNNSSSYNLFRIKEEVLIYPDELNSETLVLESPRYVNIISDNKGCYVGQEVIEKILSKGQSPYIIRSAQINGIISNEEKHLLDVITSNGETIGRVVNLERNENKTECFIRIKTKYLQMPIFVFNKHNKERYEVNLY